MNYRLCVCVYDLTQSYNYLINSRVNILGTVGITGWSTCGRPDLLVQGAGTRCAAQPGTVLVRREYTRRGRYSACLSNTIYQCVRNLDYYLRTRLLSSQLTSVTPDRR